MAVESRASARPLFRSGERNAAGGLDGTTRRSIANGRIALAGLVLFAAAAQSMLVAMIGASLVPGYSLNGNAISDLGALPQTATLFNASVILTGVLTAAGGFLLAPSLRRPWILLFFALAGAGSIGVGLAPVAVSPNSHEWLALAAFLGFSLLPAVCARELDGWMRPISAVAALVGSAYLVLMIVGLRVDGSVFGNIGMGGAERMIVYPGLLWMMALGGYLMHPRATAST